MRTMKNEAQQQNFDKNLIKGKKVKNNFGLTLKS